MEEKFISVPEQGGAFECEGIMHKRSHLLNGMITPNGLHFERHHLPMP
jgi:hypothetical protein